MFHSIEASFKVLKYFNSLINMALNKLTHQALPEELNIQGIITIEIFLSTKQIN